MGTTQLDAAENLLKRILLIGAVVLGIAIVAGLIFSSRLRDAGPPPLATAAPSPSSTRAPAGDSVAIFIDFPDGLQKIYPAVPCPEAGMTVLDALNAAAGRPRGPVVAVSGSGQTAFLTAIDHLASEGGAGAGRNWQFWVNDRFGTTGIGSATLRPGDRLIWAFRPFENDPRPPTFAGSP